MSDPFGPPPRRPAPHHLQERVLAELDQAGRRRIRPRYVILPVAAAAAAAALVLGVSTLDGRSTVNPAETASPVPPTVTAPAPTPIREAPVELNVRPMTKAEISADTKKCFEVPEGDTDPIPRKGKPKPQYAIVQRVAGIVGPSTKTVRMLITQDEVGVWTCENGSNTSWSADALELPPPTATAPAAEADSYGGGGGGCGKDAESSATSLYSVTKQVSVGRVRVNRGKTKGQWSTSTPVNGLVHFMYRVRGEDAMRKDITAQFQFLDGEGRPVSQQPYGPRGTKPTTTDTVELFTCADVRRHPAPKALERPKSDEAGVASCLTLIKEWARDDGSSLGSDFRSRLVVSTPDEWGAVFSDGKRRMACSLFPTRELSPLEADSTKINRAAFLFALNPIAKPEGESLWAAGRVPTDVTKINFRLPGRRDVEAQITKDGYWMVKFNTDGRIGDREDVSASEPLVVTVTRPSGPRTFTLPFDIHTMCHQVSHGC